MSPLDSILPFCSRQSRRLLECLLSGPLGPGEGPSLADARESVAADIAVVDEVAQLVGCSDIAPCLRGEIAAQARRHIGRLQELLAVLTEDEDPAVGAEARRIQQIQEDLQAGEGSLQWPDSAGQAGPFGPSPPQTAPTRSSIPPQAAGENDEEQ